MRRQGLSWGGDLDGGEGFSRGRGLTGKQGLSGGRGATGAYIRGVPRRGTSAAAAVILSCAYRPSPSKWIAASEAVGPVPHL